MTERMFRIFLGAGLFVLLYISAMNERTDLIQFYIGLLLFEGITNWRLPILLTRLRSKTPPDKSTQESDFIENPAHFSIPFEAERAMRLVVALILIVPLFLKTDIIWIVPWFVASMLLLSGVTNICPMVMFFRWLGFK